MANGAYYAQGVYVGRVKRHELGSSSKKGTPQFVVTFDIIDALDSFGASCGVPEVQERTAYLYLTEKAMEITVKALKVLGYHGHRISDLGDADLTGNEVELYCKLEDYEGDTQERWSINTPREKSKPVEKSELRKLDALFGKALKAQASNEPQPGSDANKAMQEASAGTNDDEVPF